MNLRDSVNILLEFKKKEAELIESLSDEQLEAVANK